MQRSDEDDERESQRQRCNLAEWDAEIEADFQRAVRATKVAGQRKRGGRHLGSPLSFWVDVCRLTEGRTALVVAMCIYRRAHVCRSQMVTLPAADLAELGIDRRRKNEALARLQAAGLIRIENTRAGHSAKVTLAWQPS
jgi:hypothetical protein